MIENLKVIKFNLLNNLNKEIIDDVIKKYLKVFNKETLYENFSLIIFEIIKNFNNSNLRDLFFKKNNINVNSFEDFKEYTTNFYNISSDQKKEYEKIIKKGESPLKLYFGLENNDFIIIVENITSFLVFEKKEIEITLNFIKNYKYLDQILQNNKNIFLNYNLILIVFLLRKIGLDENYIKFLYEDNILRIKVIFPIHRLNKSDLIKDEIIIDEILNEIKNIPQFPQHIVQALYTLNNPNSNFYDISHIIKKDPALIADILKLANSSLYVLPKRIALIEDAVRIIGLKGLKNLIIAYSTNKIFMNKYNINIIKKIMNHCTEVAIYAYELTKKFNLNSIMDYVYVCGMLHDFGKILINSINPDIISKIENICNTKGLDLWTMESLTQGYNHSFIGFKLAEKWNYPDYLKDAILFHHTPWHTTENNKTLVYTVYFANNLTHYRNKEIKFEDIDKNVLDFFDIQGKESLDLFVEEFYKIYEDFIKNNTILI